MTASPTLALTDEHKNEERVYMDLFWLLDQLLYFLYKNESIGR